MYIYIYYLKIKIKNWGTGSHDLPWSQSTYVLRYIQLIANEIRKST